MLKKMILIVIISFVLPVSSANMSWLGDDLTAVAAVPTAIAQHTSSPNTMTRAHWTDASIQLMLKKNFMAVYEDGTFRPSIAITRAEAASAIAKSLGVSMDIKQPPRFKDITILHANYQEIAKLVELEIIQNSDYFYPNNQLTRAQMTKMLALAYQFDIDSKNNSRFTDVNKTYWAKDYIESLADMGIVNGIGLNKFAPNKAVSRGHVAALIDRSLNFKQKIDNREVAYDYLAKDYITTVNFSRAWSLETIRLINIERSKQNLPPLLLDEALMQVAVIKVQDMVKRGYFEHKSPYYGAPWELAMLFDYNCTSFGENIARRVPTPAAVVAAWMASPKHHDNIMRTNFTNTGVAVQKDSKGHYYWVQMFSSQ
ncbi:MAG: S-layer homology domain-containing protein [Lysinibacillus sp.]